MIDQVLYRKYRPSSWDEVVGQDHIVSVLKNAIEERSFTQAYLFMGSRGTGKTSIARIFAKALGTNPEDIIEIDAASNRGIDDVRVLREAVRVLPFSSPFKVYIVDEVHMMTKDAFNALLKTLEEPPAHVIFILATTELDKVPETILSRCQVFSFRKPTEKILAEMVREIGEKEGVVLDSEASSLIGFLGDGSFRDTYGILQKVLSATKERKIDRATVERVTGAPSLKVLHELYSALIKKDIEACYKILQDAEVHHTDMLLLAELLLDTLRLSLMYRYAPKLRDQIAQAHSEQYVAIVEAGAVEGATVFSSASILSLITCVERMSYASVQTLPLELACLEITDAETSEK